MKPTTPTLGSQVAAEVRAEMARQDITRATLAVATDIPPYTLSRRLSGTGDLTVTELMRIAGALGVPAADLIERACSTAAS